MVSMVHLLVAAWLGVPAPTAADRTAFEVSLGAGAHSGLLVTTELHGFLGPVLSDASARAVHALGYQVRLEFAPLLYVHAVDKTRSLLHAHHLAGVGLVGPRRRLFWSAGIGMGFSPFGIGPDVEGRIGYALGRRPRLRWILGLHARTGFAIAYHQIPTTAVGAFVGLLRF